MQVPSIGEATRLLRAARDGSAEAGDHLVALLYEELHALGEVHGRRGRTMEPTALVHEVWLKLGEYLGSFEDRRHFLAAASRAMRQVLANHARSARALRRGGDRVGVTLDGSNGTENAELDLVALDDSLRRLSELDERQARVVELRFLCSLTIPETAGVLGVSEGTVKSDWTMAQAWLRRELGFA